MWSNTTKGLYNAVLIQTISGAAAALFSLIMVFQIMANPLSALSGLRTWEILIMIAGIGSLAGYILFFININKFQEIVKPEDQQAVKNIKIAMILTVVNAFLGILGTLAPVLAVVFGFITFIIGIIALVLNLMGYSALKKSPTFPEIARIGAGKIFTATILCIVCSFFAGFFLYLAPIIALIAYLAVIYSWVMQLQGWALIARSEQN